MDFILDGTYFGLTHNYFSFNGQFYLQIHGTEMADNFAPLYANLMMGYWKHYLPGNITPLSLILFFIVVTSTTLSCGTTPPAQLMNLSLIVTITNLVYYSPQLRTRTPWCSLN